ncbi:DUF6220 domain-containing protein [Paenibacillaceae bacterium WGS1546]|uniref:DUF6220 domain-containing protein n=1 Tax=Cohnella sp. WGS1546 TaxID=3366810 RepID=UPI00372D32D6
MENIKPNERGKVSRFVFVFLAWGLVVCIVAQTLLAGMALFNDPKHWSQHALFVHLFQYIPLFMIGFAFAGRLPKGTALLSLALFGLIFVQYLTANLPAAGALHPVLALALIVLSLHVARRVHASPGKKE